MSEQLTERQVHVLKQVVWPIIEATLTAVATVDVRKDEMLELAAWAERDPDGALIAGFLRWVAEARDVTDTPSQEGQG